MAKSRRAKKQIKEVNPKMGFIWRAKHGLRKHGFKDQKIGLIEKGEQTVKGRREKKRRGRRRREEEKEWRSSQASQRYGTLDFVWITWNCKIYRIKCLSPNLGF